MTTSTSTIIGIIVAVILLVAFILFMAFVVAMGILYEENPKRAEELLSKWFKTKH